MQDASHDRPDGPDTNVFDVIGLTADAARLELLRRDLLLQRYRERMAQQLAASRQASLDILRYDPAVAWQTASVRTGRLWRWAIRRHRSPLARVRRGLFLPNWYAAQYADRIGSAFPSAHFFREGLQDDLAPNPYFDPAWYRARYMTSLPLTGREPAIRHYLRIGAKHGLSPGPLFDAAAYMHDYPDIAGAPDLLFDFIVRGLVLGRKPKPVPLPLFAV